MSNQELHILPFYVPDGEKESLPQLYVEEEIILRSQILERKKVDDDFCFYLDGKKIDASVFYWRPKIAKKEQMSFEVALDLVRKGL
ncbi:hypothetical protein NUSPORA_00263 [Nucleospora cyclopteri]